MTIKEARATLSGKLIFGDARQIKAKNFINAVDEALAAYRACELGHDGSEWRDANCLCIESFPVDVVGAASKIYRKGRYADA